MESLFLKILDILFLILSETKIGRNKLSKKSLNSSLLSPENISINSLVKRTFKENTLYIFLVMGGKKLNAQNFSQ